MKNYVGIGLLLLSLATVAKKTKLYQCQQADGTVVTQDRRCEVTRLQQAKVPAQREESKKSKKSKLETVKSHPVFKSKAPVKFKQGTHSRSAFFNVEWDQFIPPNWFVEKTTSHHYHQWLFSLTRLKGNHDFRTGIKLTVYPKTQQNYQQNAFAKALTLYHQIREQYSSQLINSHFKTHERFKIFNVEYKTNPTTKAFTEFYIDEANNDLFVITIQSPHEQWEQYLALAMKLQKNL